MKDLHTAKFSWVMWKHSTFLFPKHYHRKTNKFSQLQNLKKHPTYSETVLQAPKVVSESPGQTIQAIRFRRKTCLLKPGSLSAVDCIIDRPMQPWRVKGGRIIRWDIRQQVSRGAGLGKHAEPPVITKKLAG